MRWMYQATRLTLVFAVAQALFFWHGLSLAAEMAVAKVNMQTLFSQSASIRAAFQEVEKIRLESTAQLERLALEISALEKELEKDKGSPESVEKEKLEKSLRTKREDLKAEAEAARAKFQLKRKSEENLVNMRIREIVARVARENGLKLVVPEQMALYSEGIPDITPKVLKALDAGIADKKAEEKQPTPRPEPPKP